MTVATINSRPQRKQLSDQLDRLDSILDTLSEALNGAVADAAREGTRLAVKDAIIEIMTDPTLRAKLNQVTAPEAPAESTRSAKKPGLLARLKSKASQTAKAVGGWASNIVERAKAGVTRLAQAAAELVCATRVMETVAFVGLGIGVTLGVVGMVAPQAIGLSGIGGALAANAVHVAAWTRRTVRAITAG